MPTVRAFFTNMSVPMPLHSKLRLVFRNQSINCGGERLLRSPREPGCCEGSSAKPRPTTKRNQESDNQPRREGVHMSSSME